MAYTREELDWMEAEWAFHLHGRSAFMSREDFLQLQAWAGEGVPADAIVNAMDAYFARREKRAKARAFVALEHLAKDVAKAVKLRSALDRAGARPGRARRLGRGEGTPALGPARPGPVRRLAAAPGRGARRRTPRASWTTMTPSARLFRDLVAQAEQRLGAAAEPLREDLAARLAESRLAGGHPGLAPGLGPPLEPDGLRRLGHSPVS